MIRNFGNTTDTWVPLTIRSLLPPEACVVKAGETVPKLGIKLLEANVENSSGVFEASNSLVARGAEALWVGCDMTVNVTLDSVLAAGKRGRVPVFTNQPPNASRGALFDLGANYREVGRLTGDMGVKILQGADPAKRAATYVVQVFGGEEPSRIPFETFARIHLDINRALAKKLGIAIPTDLVGPNAEARTAQG